MKREVEYEKQVTEVAEITICDDCGREVDDDGRQFRETGGGGSKSLFNDEQIDLCSECLEDFGVGVPNGPIMTAEEWYTTTTSAGNTIPQLLDLTTIILFSIAVVGVGLSFVYTGFSTTTAGFASFALICLLFVHGLVACVQRVVTDAAD